MWRPPESVYPCAYREHTTVSINASLHCGLSLCIQGTHTDNFLIFPNQRFIPVHTGNTHWYCDIILLSTVYPCAYREHIMVATEVKNNDGLSLCIQGTLITRSPDSHRCRFIPVHTGNTRAIIFLIPSYVGLSLCIQGTQFAQITTHITKRFIPVCTGNTKSVNSDKYSDAVYPCAYREHPNYNILFYN